MPTLIVLIGPIGSGKTEFCKTLIRKDILSKRGFYRVNQDEQGKYEHFKIFASHIAEGRNIVVDGMNFNRKQRMRYVEPTRKEGYKVHFILFCIDRDTCLARVKARKNHPAIDHEKTVDFFYQNFEYPQSDEFDTLERA